MEKIKIWKKSLKFLAWKKSIRKILQVWLKNIYQKEIIILEAMNTNVNKIIKDKEYFIKESEGEMADF